ncbi:hypothetical protein GPJ56_009358 [Histomonas meleagridis]|uniref:uncharacterized protein n=1 Tax=Histomonas meleagridis TaxID=135588 RepID=UPI00355AB196|nr:hypothetical protein GPJ56_009358 [Histomonas meleagridis]KAH0797310.1 hypothetical protein GO595_009992 [Histomonas meleagridis]
MKVGIDFLKKNQEISLCIENLNNSIKSIAAKEKKLQSTRDINQKKHIIEDIHSLNTAITQEYHEAFCIVPQFIKYINTLLAQNPIEDNSSGPNLPSKDEVTDLLNDFFKSKIKTMSMNPPYCGCYAYKNKKNPGKYICARYNNSYILMVILSNDGETCVAYDPTDIDNGIKAIQLKDEDWTPLTTVIPQKPIKRWEHAKNSLVLSLYKTDEQWSTVFYKATVKLQPNEKPPDEERGYTLDFGDDNIQNVPEKFVTIYPKNWQAIDQQEQY